MRRGRDSTAHSSQDADDLIHAGSAVPVGSALQPGDLIFTRGGRPTRDFGHVGMYAGDGFEVIAPRTGKSVMLQRVESDRVQAVRRLLP